MGIGSGQEPRVITLLCEFPVPEQDIRQLGVKRKSLVGKVSLGMAAAKVIVDEDAVEKLPVELVQ